SQNDITAEPFRRSALQSWSGISRGNAADRLELRPCCKAQVARLPRPPHASDKPELQSPPWCLIDKGQSKTGRDRREARIRNKLTARWDDPTTAHATVRRDRHARHRQACR